MDSTTLEEFTTTVTAATLNTRPCVLYYFIVGTLFSGSTIVIGLVGNVLSLIILGKERKKSSTIQALCLLAVADTLVLLAYVATIPILGLRKMMYGWYEALNQGVFASVYIYEVARICNQVSAFLTMILMWQRYVAVCLPHKAKQLCTVKIVNILSVCSSMAAFVFYLPIFFLYTIETTSSGVYYAVSSSLVHNAYFQMIYSVILTYLVSYIIPVVSLLYMSITILRSLKTHRNIAQSGNVQHVRKDLTKSSIAIVIMFFLCQSFQPIRRILMWVYDPYLKSALCGGDLLYFSGTPHVALMLNSSANFGIYIVFARGFRKKLLAILTRRNAVAPTSTGTNSTTALALTGNTTGGMNAAAATGTNTDDTNALAPTGTSTDGTNVVAPSRTNTDSTTVLALTGTSTDGTRDAAPTDTNTDDATGFAPTSSITNGANAVASTGTSADGMSVFAPTGTGNVCKSDVAPTGTSADGTNVVTPIVSTRNI